MLSDLKEHYWAIVLRTIPHGTDTKTLIKGRTENPEINSCGHLIYSKGAKNI